MNSMYVSGDIYIEITKSDHGHGGEGWEFGRCLWSPSKNRAGSDRYSLMRKPKKGDLVLHFYKDHWEDGIIETRLCGSSIVKKSFIETKEKPSTPGEWSDFESYYRIELMNFEKFKTPISLKKIIKNYGSEIRKEIVESRPKFYPFTTHGSSIRTVQGIYLAQCTTNLYLILKDALSIEHEEWLENKTNMKYIDIHQEYSEGLRKVRESYFFSRNRTLVKKAKELYGYKCCICGFSFEEKYGELGKNIIECHHINPLSEQSESEWTEEIKTKLEDVVVVCSNCHRIIHSKRPALSIETVKQALKNNVK